MPRREDHEVHKGHVVALGGGIIVVFLTEFTSRCSLNTQRGWHTSKFDKTLCTTAWRGIFIGFLLQREPFWILWGLGTVFINTCVTHIQLICKVYFLCSFTHHTMKAYWGSRGIAPRILYLDSRRRLMGEIQTPSALSLANVLLLPTVCGWVAPSSGLKATDKKYCLNLAWINPGSLGRLSLN